jgi:hypothetical protein
VSMFYCCAAHKDSAPAASLKDELRCGLRQLKPTLRGLRTAAPLRTGVATAAPVCFPTTLLSQ